MSNLKHMIAGLLMFGAMAVPAWAAERPDPMDGAVTVFTKTGMMHMMMTDTAMLDDLVKGATVLDEHTMIINHNGKMYLVKDHKLATGRMAYEVVEHSLMGGNN